MATKVLLQTPQITLRPVCPDDCFFLFMVFASTREEEIALTGWTAVQQDAFLRRQFRDEQEYFQAEFPLAQHSIILTDDRPIGRLCVDRRSEVIHLLDLSLLPGSRQRGIGTFLLEDLLEEGRESSKPVRLDVSRFNRAVQLCERLGFRRTGETPTHFRMEAIAEA